MMDEPQNNKEHDRLNRKIVGLEEKISHALNKKHHLQDQTSTKKNTLAMTRFGKAIRLPAEFSSGILVGFALGWIIDKIFDISPWGIIVFVVIGFCAGISNLLKATGQIKRISDKNQKTIAKSEEKMEE